jgi:CheY-like chemotaxis protein
MNKKLKCIMLIDDNDDDNFFHQRSIRKADAAETVVVMTKATEALEYLKSKSKADLPELIFLDINMPGLNGWEFIDEFKKISPNFNNSTLLMLSTSQNPDDLTKARTEPLIKGFKTKPLTVNMLEDILKEFF